MNIDQTKNVPQMSSTERELKLNQFLLGEITATKLIIEENKYGPSLKGSVLALARRNIKQGKV